MSKEQINEIRAVKKLATEQVKKITQELIGNSDWTILQLILQEIVATYICKEEVRPSIEKLIDLLKKEIKIRYSDNERVQNILIDGIPSRVAITMWMKKDGWDEAVWQNIKTAGIFTAERRASLIDALYKRGKEKSDSAAKLYLTMSGDYSDKMDISSDNTIDQFREIQQALFGKSKKSD